MLGGDSGAHTLIIQHRETNPMFHLLLTGKLPNHHKHLPLFVFENCAVCLQVRLPYKPCSEKSHGEVGDIWL